MGGSAVWCTAARIEAQSAVSARARRRQAQGARCAVHRARWRGARRTGGRLRAERTAAAARAPHGTGAVIVLGKREIEEKVWVRVWFRYMDKNVSMNLKHRKFQLLPTFRKIYSISRIGRGDGELLYGYRKIDKHCNFQTAKAHQTC
jgi:hypothetical protein